MAEGGDIFIVGEAGGIGGDFEEDTVWFAEVDGVEVLAVLDGGDALAGRGDLAEVFFLFIIVTGAEGDMVDGAGTHAAVWLAGAYEEVDEGGTVPLARLVAVAGAVLVGKLVAEVVGEDGGGGGGVVDPEGDAVEAAQGVFGGYGASGPWLDGGGVGGGDEFELEAIGVGEDEDGLAEAGLAGVDGEFELG